MTADATTPTPEERTGADMTLEEWRDERRRRKRERREAQFQREKEFHERRERERLERKRAPETLGAVEEPIEGGGTVVFGHAVRGRLNFPKGQLPPPGKIQKKGAVVSASVHLVLILIIMLGPLLARRAMGNPGEPGGGGGGGGGRTIQLINLPPAAASAPAASVAQEAVQAQVPPPEPVEDDIYTLPITEVVETATDVDAQVAETESAITLESLGLGLGQGTGDGAGQGTGTGGGIGSGEGEGIGAGIGDGTGGDGGDVLAPEPRTVIYPFEEAPDDVRGVELTVHFWVNRRGRVTKVEIEPKVQDSDFRRKLLDRMKEWVFYPARTLSGSPVDGEYFMTVTF